jgi:hypothetical protein
LASHDALESLRNGKFRCRYFCGIDYELCNLVLNLVSHAAENFCFLLGQTTGGIRVNDAPLAKVQREGEYRTPFLGRITDRDHIAETFPQWLRAKVGPFVARLRMARKCLVEGWQQE